MGHTNKMQTHLILLGFSVCMCLFLFCAPVASAQLLSSPTLATITLSPAHPTPGQTVDAALSAPGVDMSTALVTWTVDGKVVQQSYGARSVSFVVGEVGTVHHISAFAEDGKNRKASVNKSVWVSDAVLVWEGKTYIPPFYKGRALQSPGSSVAFMVIPSVVAANGTMYDLDELSYSWSINYSSVPVISAKGRNAVILKNDQPFTPFAVSVQVKDPEGVVRAEKRIELPVTQPKIILYEDSSYVGVRYEHAIGETFGVYDGETSVIAEPYHMTAETRLDPSLSYEWSIDGSSYASPGSITLGAEGPGTGSAHMGLVIRNTAYWLQNARVDTTVEFGQRNPWGDASSETTAL